MRRTVDLTSTGTISRIRERKKRKSCRIRTLPSHIVPHPYQTRGRCSWLGGGHLNFFSLQATDATTRSWIPSLPATTESQQSTFPWLAMDSPAKREESDKSVRTRVPNMKTVSSFRVDDDTQHNPISSRSQFHKNTSSTPDFHGSTTSSLPPVETSRHITWSFAQVQHLPITRPLQSMIRSKCSSKKCCSVPLGTPLRIRSVRSDGKMRDSLCVTRDWTWKPVIMRLRQTPQTDHGPDARKSAETDRSPILPAKNRARLYGYSPEVAQLREDYQCWWRCRSRQTREHLFKHCTRWRAQQKAKVEKDTKRGKRRWKMAELFADKRCSEAILEFSGLRTWAERSR